MYHLLDRIRAFAKRHDLWRPDTRVIAAISGGADSTALLILLHDLAAAGDLQLVGAAHLNHRLRGGESDRDEEFCRALAARLGVPFSSACVNVAEQAARARVSIEVAGRRARQQFFSDTLRAHDADAIATAHTQSDQAETVLLRLVRGAGLRGLAAIRPRRHHLIRPLLGCTRDQLREELLGRGETWCEDVTNQDLANPRNRVRHEVLPYLATHLNPSVSAALARFADIAAADEAWLAGLAEAAGQEVMTAQDGGVRLDIARLAGLPEGLARRVVRRALETARSDRSFDLRDADLVLAVARGDRTAVEFSGLRAERFANSAVLVSRARNTRVRRRGKGPPRAC